jgi:hypothetical protein
MGLLDDKKKSQYLQMADDKLQGLLNLRETAQRFMTNPTAFLGLLGQNPLPRESGFAAGATGMPPTEMSVLDLNQAPYMQGYGQGEPVGIAAMALPFAAPAAVATGRALAPKAGQAIESYMVNQGLLQPLTAYHGTPHNIQGKFDINKVGTGEGAQAYGHGMYFAENPAVAKNYMEFEGLPSLESKVPLQRQTRDFLNEYVDPNSKPSDWLKGAKEDAKANNRLDVLAELNKIKSKDISHTPIGGNLYKVDIPDEYIPNMLLWDQPLSKQPKAVQKALEKLDPNMYSPKGMDYDPNDLGQLIYERLTNTADKPLRDAWVTKRDELLKKGLTNNPELMAHLETIPNSALEASKLLNKLGIKGIKYKDEGSRKTNLSTNTFNFVVFDPSDVKILEKNKKKVEGLLD